MHNVVFIENLESINELLEDEQRLFLGNYPVLPQHAFQGASVAVLVDEVEIVGGFEHINVLDNVLVLLYIGQNVDLINSAFFQFLVLLESPDFDDLNGIFLAV